MLLSTLLQRQSSQEQRSFGKSYEVVERVSIASNNDSDSNSILARGPSGSIQLSQELESNKKETGF